MDSDDSDYLPDPERTKPQEDEDHHEPDDPGPQEDGEQPEATVRGKV